MFHVEETQIDKGTAEAVIHAMFGKALVLNQTLELCSVDEEMLSCPVEKGSLLVDMYHDRIS